MPYEVTRPVWSMSGMHSHRPTIQFTLGAPRLDAAVHVLLTQAGERWVARATCRGRERVGLASSPRAALTAALTPLGRPTSTALLADVSLLRPSLQLLTGGGPEGA